MSLTGRFPKEDRMSAMPPPEDMERAWARRDASYDGLFFVAVSSTGIFCRPSCPARRPLPENTRFVATARDALFAGFRPCKRCRPLHTNGRPPGWVEGLLAKVEEDPARRMRDADLRTLGLDPARVRRHFQKTYGLTFQAYCRGRRLGDALGEIREGASLDDVVLGHGYESHSGFRDAFVKTFGTPPGQSRGERCIDVDWIESPLGPLVAGATGDGVCLLEFTDRRMLEAQVTTLRRLFRRAVVPGKNPHIEHLKRELAAYFAGTLTRFTVPLVYPGTPFQRRVWEELLRVPYGETRTYEQMAAAAGSPGACRAAGTANGMNRIAVLIPCHRVVNKGGKLGGYGGGLWRKQRLLDLERETARRGAESAAGPENAPG
jgi:AraC family transcriptional regulator, regulatory protein of adaptative response / methylated-DNA-[protein]-cysteine methyltransferase